MDVEGFIFDRLLGTEDERFQRFWIDMSIFYIKKIIHVVLFASDFWHLTLVRIGVKTLQSNMIEKQLQNKRLTYLLSIDNCITLFYVYITPLYLPNWKTASIHGIFPSRHLSWSKETVLLFIFVRYFDWLSVVEMFNCVFERDSNICGHTFESFETKAFTILAAIVLVSMHLFSIYVHTYIPLSNIITILTWSAWISRQLVIALDHLVYSLPIRS